MRIAIIQGANIGFFPSFYQNLKASIMKQSGNNVQLFLHNSGVNKRSKNLGQVYYGTRINWHFHYFLMKITGKQDCWSHLSTYDLVEKLKAYKPDVLHFHVINECQINLPILVKYVNTNNIKVVWTFHDCRCFTGGCAYFDELNCQKWKFGCKDCPQLKTNTHWQWNYRREWINKIKDLQIVTPSDWLRDFVSKSFLSGKDCITIHNGIDVDSFQRLVPINVREKYNLLDKKIIMGCAIKWESRKGLLFFEKIASGLPDNCKIVLVGKIDNTVKEHLKSLGILAIGRTNTRDELISWYQESSVFVNPTLADNFPTTNIESLAAGTPVISFKTGGSCESFDATSGLAIEQYDTEGLKKAIKEILDNEKIWSRENCMKRAKSFDLSQYDLYLPIYRKNK